MFHNYYFAQYLYFFWFSVFKEKLEKLGKPLKRQYLLQLGYVLLKEYIVGRNSICLKAEMKLKVLKKKKLRKDIATSRSN